MDVVGQSFFSSILSVSNFLMQYGLRRSSGAIVNLIDGEEHKPDDEGDQKIDQTIEQKGGKKSRCRESAAEKNGEGRFENPYSAGGMCQNGDHLSDKIGSQECAQRHRSRRKN